MKSFLALFWNSPKILNSIAVICMLLALAIAATAITLWAKQLKMFQVKEVVITGLRDKQDLSHQHSAFFKHAVLPQLKGNLLGLNLNEAQAIFAQAPWIRHATIHRVWPNRLWVELEEHQAIAQLNDDLFVNEQGEAYRADRDGSLTTLPAFVGEPSNAPLLLARYKELNQWLNPNKLRVSKLVLSERLAWSVVLNDGLVLEIGRDDLAPSTAQRVQSWVNTWNAAEPLVGKGRKVDLRYPNGYAVSKASS